MTLIVSQLPPMVVIRRYKSASKDFVRYSETHIQNFKLDGRQRRGSFTSMWLQPEWASGSLSDMHMGTCV